MSKNRYITIIGMFLIVGALFLIVPKFRMTSYVVLDGFEEEIIMYKSQSCGCCGIYGNYLKNVKSNANIVNLDIDSLESLKDEYNIPNELRSCHVTLIDGYFVEGHIPLEAVDKLLAETPDIAGIAMPGMPAGSPGMPGIKNQDFVIYAVNHDGSYEEFMRI